MLNVDLENPFKLIINKEINSNNRGSYYLLFQDNTGASIDPCGTPDWVAFNLWKARNIRT